MHKTDIFALKGQKPLWGFFLSLTLIISVPISSPAYVIEIRTIKMEGLIWLPLRIVSPMGNHFHLIFFFIFKNNYYNGYTGWSIKTESPISTILI